MSLPSHLLLWKDVRLSTSPRKTRFAPSRREVTIIFAVFLLPGARLAHLHCTPSFCPEKPGCLFVVVGVVFCFEERVAARCLLSVRRNLSGFTVWYAQYLEALSVVFSGPLQSL